MTLLDHQPARAVGRTLQLFVPRSVGLSVCVTVSLCSHVYRDQQDPPKSGGKRLARENRSTARAIEVLISASQLQFDLLSFLLLPSNTRETFGANERTRSGLGERQHAPIGPHTCHITGRGGAK